MNGYGLSVYSRGLWLHTDGRHRWRGPMGWEHLEDRSFLGRGGKRGAIRGLTHGARKRLRWFLAMAPVDFAVHVTLTYHARIDESDAAQVAERNRALVGRAKRDLNRFRVCVGKEIGRHCWIQEFQKRGAIHFHFLCERAIGERRAALAWCRATGQLHDPHALAHAVRVEVQIAARKYLVRYFGKALQKELPAGVQGAGRFWGGSRSLVATPLGSVVSAEPKGKKHDASSKTVRRVLQRYVSRLVGFKWRGGRFVCWDGDVPKRVLRAMDELKAFYHETGYLVEMAERSGWDRVEPEAGKRSSTRNVPGSDVPWVAGADWNGGRAVA